VELALLETDLWVHSPVQHLLHFEDPSVAMMQQKVDLSVAGSVVGLLESARQQDSSGTDAHLSCLALAQMGWRVQQKIGIRGKTRYDHVGEKDPSGWCSEMATSRY
jgi:hypothetical protein